MNYFFAYITSILIAIAVLPIIIRFCYSKNILDETGERKIHHKALPVLGGIGVILSSLLSFLLWSSSVFETEMLYFLCAAIVLSLAGIADDIYVLKPGHKFFMQLLAAFILVIPPDFRIHGLHGWLGIYQLQPLVSIIFTMAVIISLVNAWNFIDGMDGLATSLALTSCIGSLVFFSFSHHEMMMILVICLIAALMVFLHFNIQPAKIFLGDNGSMFIGISMALMTIVVLNTTSVGKTIEGVSLAMLALNIGFIPFADLIFVCLLRIAQRKMPFTADEQHLHHQLLQKGWSQKKILSVLLAIQMVCIAISFIALNPELMMSVLFILFLVVRIMLHQSVRKQHNASLN